MDVSEMVKTACDMPNARYANLWDSIVVDSSIKDRLLRSAALSLRLRAELPFEATALHGLAFLYGPPGTGKTTLARGLAHQLAPLTTRRKARFIEINPHGLMSAEHGQSQRRVTELLTEHIPSMVDDGIPTVVLLDEVESMVVARSQASLAANPADVHRATDAVLTAIDSNASALPHLIFVATSNFTGAIDEAFLSRADVAIYVPTPVKEYWKRRDCIARFRAYLIGKGWIDEAKMVALEQETTDYINAERQIAEDAPMPQPESFADEMAEVYFPNEQDIPAKYGKVIAKGSSERKLGESSAVTHYK